MAGLDARTDNFISLLIDVSGRVRPGDLPGLTDQESTAVLEQYQAAHPELGLSFNGGVLTTVPVAQASQQTYAAPAPLPQEPVPTSEFPADTAAAPEGPQFDAGESTPSWTFGEEQQTAEAAAFTPGPEVAAPLDADAQEMPGVLAAPAVDTFTAPIDAPAGPAFASDDFGDQAAFAMPPARVSPAWWLAVVFFGFPGALVAWLVNRRSNPQGAKPFLIVGIVLLVLAVVSVAAFAFGGIALLGGAG